MKANLKCSHCGAEITNLNLSWKKQWLWMLLTLPFLAIAMLPMWKLYRPKGDYHKDLQVTVLEKLLDENRPEIPGMKDHPEFLVTNYELEILGTIRNVGKTEWERIELQMEFFDAEGKFVDEASGGVTGSVKPGEVEHFKLTISNPSPAIRAGGTRMEMKVADASSSLF